MDLRKLRYAYRICIQNEYLSDVTGYEKAVRYWSESLKDLFIKQIESGVEKISYVLNPTLGIQLEYLRLQLQEQNIILKLIDKFSNRKELFYDIKIKIIYLLILQKQILSLYQV